MSGCLSGKLSRKINDETDIAQAINRLQFCDNVLVLFIWILYFWLGQVAGKTNGFTVINTKSMSHLFTFSLLKASK